MKNFNPRPPCGGRLQTTKIYLLSGGFQSTSPVWRTTNGPIQLVFFKQISIHVPRVEDDQIIVTIVELKFISIHVPRVEGDINISLSRYYLTHFNPRPPCGGRLLMMLHSLQTYNFNPRPPCGGRRRLSVSASIISDFNPRPPCGGRPVTAIPVSAATYFNPRPPCGGRRLPLQLILQSEEFQSTSPVWRTTTCSITFHPSAIRISIHVPRVEDDFTKI